MMDCSDRHSRYFLRLFSQNILLYTEMVTAAAIIHGNRDYLLGFSEAEHPIAVQLGGEFGGRSADRPDDRTVARSFGKCATLFEQP